MTTNELEKELSPQRSLSPSKSSWMSTSKSKQENLRDWSNTMLGEPPVKPKKTNFLMKTVQAEIADRLNIELTNQVSLAKKKKKKKKKKLMNPLHSFVIDESSEYQA
jgi:hypothetical protein